jgi:hypothetical protein
MGCYLPSINACYKRHEPFRASSGAVDHFTSQSWAFQARVVLSPLAPATFTIRLLIPLISGSWKMPITTSWSVM